VTNESLGSTMRAAIVLGLALWLAACGGEKVDLGGADGGGVGDDSGMASDTGTAGDTGTPADGGTTGDDGSPGSNPLSGTYKGYIESFKFPDGSDTVVMTLTFAANGTVTGTVFFGDGPPLAPPTDPSVGYPPGYSNLQAASLLEGFAFAVLGGAYAAPRLTLGFDPAQLWAQWCPLQTPYPFCNCPSDSDGGCPPGSSYACLPNSAMGSMGSTCNYMPCGDAVSMPIDCGRMNLCTIGSSPCKCTAAGCTVPVPAMPSVTFDMQLASGALDGSESGIGGSVLNVHLTKQ
jgi:hypothetical protein